MVDEDRKEFIEQQRHVLWHSRLEDLLDKDLEAKDPVGLIVHGDQH